MGPERSIKKFRRIPPRRKGDSEELIKDIRSEIRNEIEGGLEIAFAETGPEPDTKTEWNDLYAPHFTSPIVPDGSTTSEKRYLDAITDAMRQSMQRHPNLIIMGQDVAEYGGVFKATLGFADEFGKARVRNTPICESAIIGAGLGLSINGFKSIIEMQCRFLLLVASIR